jgi:hypothetical protein
VEDAALEQIILPAESVSQPERLTLLQSQLEGFIEELRKAGVG